MPLQCIKIDKIVMNLTEEDHLKYSALCIAIAEFFRGESFEIFWSDEMGFFVKLSKSGIKRLRYKDYKLEGNILTWIG